MKQKLMGMTLMELQDAALSCGLKAFVGRQLADWLYAKRVTSWDGLHNPFPDERAQMMPAQKAFSEGEILRLIRRYDFSGQRRVSFEYTMFDGFNDDRRHADALIHMLRGLECRVNLIRFHKIPDFPYGCSPTRTMEAFRDRLNENGILCTIRSSRGEDILAACGMLAGQLSPQRQD